MRLTIAIILLTSLAACVQDERPVAQYGYYRGDPAQYDHYYYGRYSGYSEWRQTDTTRNGQVQGAP